MPEVTFETLKAMTKQPRPWIGSASIRPEIHCPEDAFLREVKRAWALNPKYSEAELYHPMPVTHSKVTVGHNDRADETLWAKNLDGNRYEILSIPYFHDYARGDIVEAWDMGNKLHPYVMKVLKQSGRRSFVLVFSVWMPEAPMCQDLFDILRQSGAGWERFAECIIVIDLPTGRSLPPRSLFNQLRVTVHRGGSSFYRQIANLKATAIPARAGKASAIRSRKRLRANTR